MENDELFSLLEDAVENTVPDDLYTEVINFLNDLKGLVEKAGGQF